MASYDVTSIIVVVFTQLIFAGAFAAFIPETNDVIDDIEYDITKPETMPFSEDRFYKALSHVLLGYVASQRDALNDYIESKLENGPSYGLDMPKSAARSSVKRIVDKRKVFWQPLGYLPPGSRQVNSGTNTGYSDKNRGQVFRYG